MSKQVSYQTNFTGIKYSNNPLSVDINSFSNSNNVYLNKYGALISRSPVTSQDYPWQVYGQDPVPINVKMVALYNLSNGGIVYVFYNGSLYILRYKTPAGVYSTIIASTTINSYDKFKLIQYRQYYIMFTSDGTRVLDTTLPTNSWVNLSQVVDIPITSIQTGNSILELEANKLTGSYKKQFIVKPDSDDTIYALPTNETATVTFPSQTELTYQMTTANEYSRERLIHKLKTPSNNDPTALISIVGEKIAIAHEDRFDLSLDYGETFQTIVYPTVAGVDYKNTASLSDDGQCFFYVHTNGVYRYMLGTEEWTLIEVSLHNFIPDEDPITSLVVERPIYGLAINATAQGANYCHFVNAEKFAFMLAHYRVTEDDWISVVYAKGLNLTNVFDQSLASGANLLNSFALDESLIPLNIIGSWIADGHANLNRWLANPQYNSRTIKILDNNTLVCYAEQSETTSTGLFFKAAPTHVVGLSGEAVFYIRTVAYVAVLKHSLNIEHAHSINEVVVVLDSAIKLLLHEYMNVITWRYQTIVFSITEATSSTYDISFYIQANTTVTFTNQPTDLASFYRISDYKYLANNKLIIVDSASVVTDVYTLPITVPTTNIKVITDGPNYLIQTSTGEWYTNLPLLATLTYTYLDDTEFTEIPSASYSDQYLWLALDKTLWIGNLVNDKLLMLPTNSNKFAKSITGICPISTTSKAIFFADTIMLCEESVLNDGTVTWYYYPLKFSVGVRNTDSVITTNEGKLTIFPTRAGLAALTYQLDIAATDQAITYLTDDIKTLWTEFYLASTNIKILHHNTQLILVNGTNKVLIYDFRTNGWYPQTLPTNMTIGYIQPNAANEEVLELQTGRAAVNSLTAIYHLDKEADELYSYATPYKDLGTLVIPWHLTSQLLLLEAINNYKNISKLIIDQVDSHGLKQSAYLTVQLFRQRSSQVKPSMELIYDIDTFAKVVKKVNWWKVLGLKWQLENDASAAYPTQLRLYNFSIDYDISYEVK